jgi:hypothetical protein
MNNNTDRGVRATTRCSPVRGYSCFGEQTIYRTGPHGVTIQDTTTKIFTAAVRTVLHFKHFGINFIPLISVCSISHALLYCGYSSYANTVSHSSLIHKHRIVSPRQQINTCAPPVYLHGAVLGHFNHTT